MPNVEPVGYHTWIDPKTTAVFILGESFSLHLAKVGDDPSLFLADNIGRALLFPFSDAHFSNQYEM